MKIILEGGIFGGIRVDWSHELSDFIFFASPDNGVNFECNAETGNLDVRLTDCHYRYARGSATVDGKAHTYHFAGTWEAVDG